MSSGLSGLHLMEVSLPFKSVGVAVVPMASMWRILYAVHGLQALLFPFWVDHFYHVVDHVTGKNEAKKGEDKLDAGMCHFHVFIIHVATIHITRFQRMKRVET